MISGEGLLKKGTPPFLKDNCKTLEHPEVLLSPITALRRRVMRVE